jgi:class 3 adenylate cyclase
LVAATHGAIQTFLIADIRGYTRFTEQFGDEAAGRLAAKFADIFGDGIELRGGTVVEISGDEAVAVFGSARQAIRAAMDLQAMFSDETDPDSDLPLRVGIGIDSGEAVALGEGYRGAALNVAARLCALAHGGDVLTTAGTARLAGKLPGYRYLERGEANLKGIDEPTHVMRIGSESDKQSRWLFLFSPTRKVGWRLAALAALIAAATAISVVYLTGGSDSKLPPAAAKDQTGTLDRTTPEAATELALIPPVSVEFCQQQAVPDPNATDTVVCTNTESRMPDRWQLSIFPNGKALRSAYEAIRTSHRIEGNTGTCSAFSWGGEQAWEHGPRKPGGRRLCYFEGDDAVIVWTHQKFDQPDHRDMLGIAREGGSDHSRLFHWWNYWHHRLGRLEG